MSPVYSRSLHPRRLRIRQDEADELLTKSSQKSSSTTSTFTESSSAFADDLTSSLLPTSTDSTASPDFTSTSESETESDSVSTSSTSIESSSSPSETESVSSTSESTSSSESESLDSETLTSSPASSENPTSTPIPTSTPVVTVTVDEESSSSVTSSSSSTTEEASRSIHVKVESITSTRSSPETTFVVKPSTSSSIGNAIQTTEASAADPSSTGGVSAAAESDNGFWENKSAIGGTFAVVGLTVLVFIFLITRIILRRRRARAEMLDEKFAPFPTGPTTHYRDESFSTPYTRQPSPTELNGNPLNAYDQNVYYDTAAYYDAESSDHSHSHESGFSAYPGLAQAPTNVYLPPMAPSPATAPSTTGRPSTAQSQNQPQHQNQNPFSDPASSTTTLERSPFADPVPQAGSHLRPQAPVASHTAGRISSLYTASEVDSFYGDAGSRAV